MEQVENPSYSPHLKKVLKSYQTAAMTSLSGPNTFMAGWGNSVTFKALDLDIKKASCALAPSNGRAVSPNDSPLTSSKDDETKKNNYSSSPASTTAGTTTTTSTNSSSNGGSSANTGAKFLNFDQFPVPASFPIQQVPILTAPDQSRSERSETVLEGETISCFVVGGERRLCLPQILNSVLRDFSLQQINAVCDELQIFCSRCNHEQLEVLKGTGILPFSAPSCGLITKTDGERLCNALLHCHPPRAIHDLPPEKRPFHFKIYHECFGKCKGIYTPDHYTSETSRCIECTECHGLFAPDKFVGHAHKALENRTCHWGFDSANWQAYILLAKDQENTELLQKQLDELKERFSGVAKNSTGKRKQGDVEDKEVIKKIKYEDTYYPYVYDPMLTYLYGGVPAMSRVSAFRPWSPIVLKDGKLNLPAAPPPPSFMRENIPHPLPPYLSHGPPVLLNPERVVSHSETERFERHYQPNVALAPPAAQIQAIQKANSTVTALAQAQRAAPKPVAPTQKALPTCNPEIELSTDTDETFSDSTTCSSLESPTCSPANYKMLPGSETAVCDTDSTKMETDDLDVVKELENIQALMDDEGVEKAIQDKILEKITGICCQFEQKLDASHRSKRQLQEELDSVKNSKRERLREAAKTKRMLRKEVDRLCEEQIRRDRETEELRKEADALRHCSMERAHEVHQNEQMRSKIDGMGNELMKLQEELFKLRKRGSITVPRSKETKKNDMAALLNSEVHIKKEIISPDGV